MKINKYILLSKLSILLTVPIIIIIGELGRLNILPDGRSVPPVVHGIQGLLVILWMGYNFLQMKKYKGILNDSEACQTNQSYAITKFDLAIRILLPAALLFSFFNTSIFTISLLILIIVGYFSYK